MAAAPVRAGVDDGGAWGHAVSEDEYHPHDSLAPSAERLRQENADRVEWPARTVLRARRAVRLTGVPLSLALPAFCIAVDRARDARPHGLQTGDAQAAADALAIVAALVDADANLTLGEKAGNPPLIEAARWGLVDVARELVRGGADPNVPGSQGELALVVAVETCDPTMPSNGQTAG